MSYLVFNQLLLPGRIYLAVCLVSFDSRYIEVVKIYNQHGRSNDINDKETTLVQNPFKAGTAVCMPSA